MEAQAPVCQYVGASQTFACTAALGTAALGDACTRPTNMVGADTCMAGLYCSNFGMAASQPQQRTCKAFCSPTAPCGSGLACVGLPGVVVGSCAPTCTLFSSSCGQGQKCAAIGGTDSSSVLVCTPVGPKALHETCTVDQDCPLDAGCFGNGTGQECQPYCDNAHPCAEPTGACRAITNGGGLASCRLADYACLGSVMWPAPTAAQQTVDVTAVNGLDGTAMPGAAVKVCAANDAPCASPLDTQMTNTMGTATVTVPTTGTGFTGHFEVVAAGQLTALLYANTPLSQAGMGLTVPLLTAALVEGAVVGAQTLDPARGSLLVSASDCLGFRAGGVTFSLSTADASSTVAQSLPSNASAVLVPNSFDAAQTVAATGDMLAVNIPAGTTTVLASLAGGMTLASFPVDIRAGCITVVLAQPAP